MVWAVFPPIGEVVDACIEYGAGNVRGYGGIVKDARFKLSVGIGASQHSKGVVLFPSCIPIEFFEPHQILSKVCHSVVSVAKALDFSLKRGVPFAIEGKVNHW